MFNHRHARTRVLVAALVLIVALGAAAARSESDRDHLLGLPPVPIPIGNAQTHEKIALGRAIFDDKRFSADGTVSCATCHRKELAHSDGLSVAEGVQKRKGTRNAPSLVNVAYLTSLFWDGRRESLEAQAQDPFVNPAEHALDDQQALLDRVRGDREYTAAFDRVFGIQPGAITMDHVVMALAAFQRTLVAGDSLFDRYQYGGDKSVLSPSAVRGLSLFRGRADCAKCHTIGPTSALFTDQAFHSLGVGFKRIEPRLADVAAHAFNTGGNKQGHRLDVQADLSELGRFMVTKKGADIGHFKTPSLRNVAMTAPYMHDGSIPTLEAAVELEVYYRGIEAGRPLILTPQEKSDLVDFLKALTSSQFAPPNQKRSQ